MNDNTKAAVALLAGLAAGAALGILFAPEKGTETRDKLNDAIKDISDAIKDRAAEEIEHISAIKDQLFDNVKSKFNKAENHYNEETSL